MNLIIILLILIISNLLFVIIVLGLEYVPEHYYTNIDLTKGIAISLVLSATFITYYINYIKENQLLNDDYINNIIASFDKIDDYLINNYDENSSIIKILYNKINIPSSNTNINIIFKNLSVHEKNNLFLIYDKITYNMEKMFLIHKKLFDNNVLGIRIRLYIDNICYYEFWNNTQNLYKTEFVDFMNSKYYFLKRNNNIYNKPNSNINTVHIPNSIDFIR